MKQASTNTVKWPRKAAGANAPIAQKASAPSANTHTRVCTAIGPLLPWALALLGLMAASALVVGLGAARRRRPAPPEPALAPDEFLLLKKSRPTDRTPKGGVLVALADKFGLPIHAIGVGEKIDDLRPFDPDLVARVIAGVA